jgi:hypothetical protein
MMMCCTIINVSLRSLFSGMQIFVSLSLFTSSFTAKILFKKMNCVLMVLMPLPSVTSSVSPRVTVSALLFHSLSV